tara:strand:- start:385 stop:1224 length:840 start_codon:yes stop_codon:yes gene_type:complete
MIQHSAESLKMSTSCAEEFPMAVQLAGCEPEIMAKAAQMNVERGANIIDINFGCPVKKIVNKMGGSALMRDMDLATDIMAATVKAVTVPVTVKMRLGWDEDCINAPELARRAEDVGIKMVTVHGRTRMQMYKGHANWTAIAPVKQAVSIPVIANGDIATPQQAQQTLKQSGADGVMVGRGTQGRPWAVRDIMHFLRGDDIPPPPTPVEMHALIVKHYNDIIDYYGQRTGVALARKHLAWYASGLHGANAFRERINKLTDPQMVRAEIDRLFAQDLKNAA